MELGLLGNVVAVFGAASGIGAAIARAFAAEGARVAALDLDPARHESAGQPPGSIGLVADVCDYAAVKRAALEITRQLGQCEHLVYAVGAGSGKFGFPFWNLEPADWERVLKVNLLGAVNVAHAFAPAMAQAHANGGGSAIARLRSCFSHRSRGRSVHRPILPTAQRRPGSSTSLSAPPRTWHHLACG